MQWTTYLMRVLDGRRPTYSDSWVNTFREKLTENHPDEGMIIALLLEIASQDRGTVKRAALEVLGPKKEDLFHHDDTLALVSLFQADVPYIDDPEAGGRVQFLINEIDGKIRLVGAFPWVRSGSWTSVFYLQEDGSTEHDMLLADHGLRDLSRYSSQRLSKDKRAVLERTYRRNRGARRVQAAVPKTDVVDLDKLLESYLSYGLPIPPVGSVPILLPTGSTSGGIEVISVAFKSVSSEGQVTYHVGTQSRPRSNSDKEQPLSLDQDLPELLTARMPVHYEQLGDQRDLFYEDNIVAVVIQSYALGHKELADVLAERWLPPETTLMVAGSTFQQPSGAGPERRVAYLALQQSVNRWMSGEGDFNRVVKVIEQAVASKQLWLESGIGAELDGFRSSLVPNTAVMGSIVWSVNDLVNLKLRALYLWEVWFPPNGPSELPYRREEVSSQILPDAKFEDLLVLAEYVDDKRWTRTAVVDGRHPWRGIATVGNLVRFAIARLSGGNVCSSPANGSREDVLAYYRAAKNNDLVQFWKDALEPSEEEQARSDHPFNVDGSLARKFAELYPEECAETYLEIVTSRDDLWTWGYSFAIMDCSLPWSRRIDLLEEATRSPWPFHRYPALERLGEMGAVSFPDLLASAYDSIPSELGSEDEAEFVWHASRIATQTRSRESWSALRRLFLRADAPTKVVVAQHVSTKMGGGYANTDLSAKFLAEFIDDPATVDEELYPAQRGSGLFEEYPWMTIGDYVVIQLGRLLHNRKYLRPYDQDAPTNPFRGYLLTEEKMARLRALVNVLLLEEGFIGPWPLTSIFRIQCKNAIS